MKLQYSLAASVLAMLAITGCTSIRSTMLLRTDNNSYVGNSNGYAKCDGETRPFKGVPITVEVPTHLDVSITETYYMFSAVKPDPAANDKKGNLADVAANLQEVQPTTRRNLGVKAEIVKTKKMFTVDFKRPAAGVLAYNATFKGQYFDAIDNEIEDRTINDTADAIATVLPKLASLTSAGKGVDPSFGAELQNRVVKGERVVAYQRFDLNSPSFEYDVEQFVNQHLNCEDCHGNCLNCPTETPFGSVESQQSPTADAVTELPAEYFTQP